MYVCVCTPGLGQSAEPQVGGGSSCIHAPAQALLNMHQGIIWSQYLLMRSLQAAASPPGPAPGSGAAVLGLDTDGLLFSVLCAAA